MVGIESELLGYVNNNSIDLWLRDRTGQNLTRWFSRIEEVCNACGLLEGHYAEAAIIFIQSEHLALVMREKQQQYLSNTSHTYWLWADFKERIRETIVAAENRSAPTTDPSLTTVHEKDGSRSTDAESKKKDGGLVKFARFCEENPGAALVGAGLTAAGAAVVVPALGIAVLSAVGFTSSGVAGGSLAALAQSVFYGPATGGLFSILQSAGATAVMPSAATLLTGSAAATAAGAATLASGVGGEDDDSDGPHSGEDTPPQAQRPQPSSSARV